MVLGVDGVSSSSADYDFSPDLSIRGQVADIAVRGDEAAARSFLNDNPLARTLLNEELLRSGQVEVFNAIASNPSLPYQLAQSATAAAGASPGAQLPTFSGVSPGDLARIGTALRAGNIVGLAITLTSPPPRPHVVQVAEDVLVAFNTRRYEHNFYFKGDDGKWRKAPVKATGSPDGLLLVNLGALSKAYGRELPPHIVNMTTVGVEALQGGSILEARARPSGVPAQLQTTSSVARTALGLMPHDQMQAHHLIPANVWGDPTFAVQFTMAQTAGWRPDAGNLIALPANQTTQARLSASGINLPIHKSSHPNYDEQVAEKLDAAFDALPEGATPAQIHATIKIVAASMATELRTGLWMPRVH